MTRQPSPYLYALKEPWHVLWLVVWLAITLAVDSHAVALGAGGVLEAFYLFGFARSSAYARRVQLKAILDAKARRSNELALKAAELRKDTRKRYRRLEKLYREVSRLLIEASERSDVPLEVSQETLDEIQESALEISLMLQRIRGILETSSLPKLKKDLAAWKRSADDAGEGRSQAVELLEKRVARLEELADQKETLEGQLSAIEQTLLFLREQLGTLDIDAKLATDVAALVSSLETTRRTVRELGAYQADAARIRQWPCRGTPVDPVKGVSRWQ